MRLFKVTVTVALLIMGLSVTSHADETIPYNGKIHVDGPWDSRSVFKKMLSTALPEGFDALEVTDVGHEGDPKYFWTGIGKLHVDFKFGHCTGPTYSTSQEGAVAALKNGDFGAARAFFSDYMNRASCEQAHTGSCSFSYKYTSDDRLRIWALPETCISHNYSLADKTVKDAAVEIYRIDGNNAGITDVQTTDEPVHQP